MKDNHFNFCPNCGSQKIETFLDQHKWSCPECGFELFNNVAASTAVIITNDKNEALFEVRAKEPRKGYLCLPGGFCEPGETAESSIRRECAEEIGFTPDELRFIGSYPNIYHYHGIVYRTCDLFYETDLPKTYNFNIQKSEVTKLEWHRIDSKEAIVKLSLAFESTRNALLKRLSQ